MRPSKRCLMRSNLILCGTPAKKVPEPPDSNDFKKPRILKALEAVIAAGRRGLLGPAAAAAVEAMDLEFCNSQETPSSSPLVGEEEDEGRGKEKEEGKKKKEVVNKESVVSVLTPIKGKLWGADCSMLMAVSNTYCKIERSW
uniref:Uncharacterized protein n=1 Tax=Sphaerodactylus townsendi TaxID=933632 RepID=A0ACB8EJT9_9SAUR